MDFNFGFDAVDAFEHDGWHFLCSGEQLPDGTFHAVLRCRVPPGGGIRTLRLGSERLPTASQARDLAREIAVQWAADHAGERPRTS